VERVTLWRRARRKRIGVVELDDQKRLVFHIEATKNAIA
jgi:hypothetical protein